MATFSSVSGVFLRATGLLASCVGILGCAGTDDTSPSADSAAMVATSAADASDDPSAPGGTTTMRGPSDTGGTLGASPGGDTWTGTGFGDSGTDTAGTSDTSDTGGADDSAEETDACADAHEPNDKEAEATFLGNLTDNDSDGKVLGGVLSGNEADWFRYLGTDESFSLVNPSREVQAGVNVRICKFGACVNGLSSTEVDCESGDPATSPEGRPGCCASDGAVEIDINCTGTASDDAHIYMRIDGGTTNSCTPYTVDFHY